MSGIYETLDEYIKNINDLILAVSKVPSVYLAIRLRRKTFPGMSLTEIHNLFYKIDCYDIFTEGDFDNYLSVADLVVSYSSTAIEEALIKDIPVLLYDPAGKYSHIPINKDHFNFESLDEKVKFVTNIEGLINELHNVKCIRNKKISSKTHDCTRNLDGQWILDLLDPTNVINESNDFVNS